MPNAKSLIYSLNPAVVYCRNSLVDMLLLSIRPTLKISSNDDNYIVKYKDFTIWINKESALPERSQFYDEQTHENIYRYHEFIFNQTTIDDLQVVNYDNYLEI